MEIEFMKKGDEEFIIFLLYIPHKIWIHIFLCDDWEWYIEKGHCSLGPLVMFWRE